VYCRPPYLLIEFTSEVKKTKVTSNQKKLARGTIQTCDRAAFACDLRVGRLSHTTSCLLTLWPCLDTLAGLELELVSNSSSSTKLTLALEVFG
jgi:hypothetical protein